MPEGPEVKIASDYFNNFFSQSKKIEFKVTSKYYHQKYLDVFDTIKHNLNSFKATFTIGKNIFWELSSNKILNLHLGMTGGWERDLVKHCHFRVSNGKKEIFFRDIRKFGKIKIRISKRYKLTDAKQAHEDLEARRLTGPAILIP